MKLNDAPLPAGARRAPVLRLRGGRLAEVDDWLCEEIPIAFEFNGIAHAVMLATPMDLEDFALGFSLSEGILSDPTDLLDCEIVSCADGLTVHMNVSSRCFARLKLRRRTLAGRTGCGICGTESLAQVLRPVPLVQPAPPVHCTAIARAMQDMRERQALCMATGATHAAAWCDPAGNVRVVREDVGRHNALDKLIGALIHAHIDSRSGFIAVTSRASVEMVQKAAVAGVPLLAAVSAPTQLAVDTARRAGMCLVGLARQQDLVVYAQTQSVILEPRD